MTKEMAKGFYGKKGPSGYADICQDFHRSRYPPTTLWAIELVSESSIVYYVGGIEEIGPTTLTRWVWGGCMYTVCMKKKSPLFTFFLLSDRCCSYCK